MLLILGLIFGSYITALSYRFPRFISNVTGRSFCDNCRKTLFWYDNIPLLSYLILLGKCRHCGKKISFRYPAIEIISALGFYVIGFNILNLALFVIMLSILVIDLEHQIIPDIFIQVGIVIALIVYGDSSFIFERILAGFLSSLILLFLHLITKGKGMGLGDVKFALLAGMIVGINHFLVWLFIAFLTGGLVGSILILLRIAKLKDKIAFGPFLIVSIPLSILWGEKILKLLL